MSTAESASAALPSTFCPQQNRRFVLAAAILASALGFIDGSIVSIAMPAMRTDLGASLAQAQWISNSYALILSALILVGGAAGDRFGLRNTFVAGIVLFIVASLACALAPDAGWLIACRAVQGAGAAIMVPCSLAIIAKAYPKAERGRAIGIWAAASALTTALGPVIGGLLLSSFDASVWRGIFAVNLPLGLIAVWLLLARVPVDRPSSHRRLDIGGAVLAAVGFGALALGLTLAGESGAGRAMGLTLVVAVVVLGLFVAWELRHREPMIDLSLFRGLAFSGANLSTFFLYFALSAILFFLPMLLIAGWNIGAGEAGFIFVPLSVAIALLSTPVGQFADRAGPRVPIALGSLVVAAAFAGLAALSAAGIHEFWRGIFPLMTLMGLGMALVVSPLSTAVMTAVDDASTGAASGINNAVARVAGLVAVAAMGAVASAVYASATAQATGLPGYGESVVGALDPALDAVRVAASDAAFAAVAGGSALFCLLSAVIAWVTLDRPAAR